MAEVVHRLRHNSLSNMHHFAAQNVNGDMHDFTHTHTVNMVAKL